MTPDVAQQDLTIGIIGAGAMGRGVAQVAATGGCRVRLFDSNPESLGEAIEFIGRMLARAVEKNRLSADEARAAGARLLPAASLAEFGDCPVVIEAAIEDLAVKRRIFAELEDIVAEDAILASNTSSLSITTIAAGLRHPERLAGMHFFNPVPLMKLVEVIDGLRTAPAVGDVLMALAGRMGREPVRVRDTPGFVVNQVGRGYNIEAAHALAEGVAEPADMDRIMREAAGFPMGPFELMDLTALDVTHPATELIYRQFYEEPRFRPSPLMQMRREAGLLGRKSGEGFYAYTDGRPQPADEAPAPDYDGRPVWVSKAQPQHHQRIIELLTGLEATLEDGERPSEEALCLVAPLGQDATAAAVAEGLNAEQTLALDCLFDLRGRRTLMKTPVTDPRFEASARGLLAGDGMAVAVIRDSAGFVSQRILAMIVNIGCAVAQSGAAAPADIDRAVKLGLGYPLGPLAFGDKLGAPRILEILSNLNALTGDPRYRPTPWLRRRAQLGKSLLTPEVQY